MESEKAVIVLEALAQESRLRIFRELVHILPDGRLAGHLAEVLGIPPSTLTSHLQKLAAAELVEFRANGRQRIYRARLDTMNILLEFLMSDCCQGRPAACSGLLETLQPSDDTGLQK